jgi:hypothetical protein
MEWFFSGLGTAIISFFLGVVSGGIVGYRIAIIKKSKQKQKAGNNSQQIQIGGDYHGQ